MEDCGAIKELYDVNIRTNAPIEINGKKYEVNESILSFKSIELAQLSLNKKNIAARGGYQNALLINWETDTDMTFGITNGVLSPKSWALLSNSNLRKKHEQSVSYSETLKVIEQDSYFYVSLKYIPNNCVRLGAQPNPNLEPLPMGRRSELMLKPLPPSLTKWIFIYDVETGKRIKDFSVFDNVIYFKNDVREVIIDYTFSYHGTSDMIEIGNRLINGFLRLEGKMSIKDEKSGEVSTVLLELPKIKLSSSLSMRLGKSCANSVVSDFYFTVYPDTSQRRDNRHIANITFLDIELTGDYI